MDGTLCDTDMCSTAVDSVQCISVVLQPYNMQYVQCSTGTGM